MCKAKVLTCIVPEARLRRNPSPSRSTLSIFQSVITCVPTGWSYLSDSSTTHISIYYGHMIAMEGVATSEARCTVTTKKMLTYDPSFSSLDRRNKSFMTIL
jgi:hypothetical protein